MKNNALINEIINLECIWRIYGLHPSGSVFTPFKINTNQWIAAAEAGDVYQNRASYTGIKRNINT